MHAKPRSGKSKGKIEKFHQVVDDFIRESKLKNIRTLEELNRLWAVYLEEYYHEQRKVDRGACVSVRGKRYETKPSLIGHTVEISYDPAAPEQITVSYQGMEPFTAAPLKIGSYCDKRPALPASMQEQTPTTSRFLDALEKRHEQNRRQMADAISFAAYRKEADD